MIRLRLEAHRDTANPDLGIEVDIGDVDDGVVMLILDPQHAETFDDLPVERVLLPAEARALGAMLRHFADMAERR